MFPKAIVGLFVIYISNNYGEQDAIKLNIVFNLCLGQRLPG